MTLDLLVLGEEEQQTKVTTSMRTIIPGLLKYANYSMTVLAFTAAGDGVRSAAIFCRTDEDGTSVQMTNNLFNSHSFFFIIKFMHLIPVLL